jgi:FAD synthase
MTTEVTTMTPQGRQARTPEDAARRLYDAEVALHIARQTGVDAWISAAYDRLHEAIAAHTAALAPTACPTRRAA